MKIIAKTQSGYILESTTEDVKQILSAVTGKEPKIEDITIGQKLPAIDYASTIRKVKSLKDHYNFKYLKEYLDKFNKEFDELNKAVESAANVDI